MSDGALGPALIELFRFVQLEWPGELGTADGRYLVRDAAAGPDSAATHVLVIATMGAGPRRHLARRSRRVEPLPDPPAVPVTRTTIVTAPPLSSAADAGRWLASAGEDDVQEALHVLQRALQAQRISAADAYARPVPRDAALVARVGFGSGESVADGRWTEARELTPRSERRRRAQILAPQSRVARLLGGRERFLLCEELALRARLDHDLGLWRLCAVELAMALELATDELPAGGGGDLGSRLAELEARRASVAPLAAVARRDELPPGAGETLGEALGRLEAALRARSASAS